jgi:hypothetical protein
MCARRYTIGAVHSPPGPGCALCGRPTFDPDKKERQWSRGVIAGRQALICPACQVSQEDWSQGLDRCERCGSVRLSVMLGEVVCRQCGHVGGEHELAWLDPAGPGT